MSQIETPVIRCRSLRVTLAWAIIGAAAGVALMHAPPIYTGQSHDCSDVAEECGIYCGPTFSNGRVWVCGVEVYHENFYGTLDDARPEVEQWHRRVTAIFAGLGALTGVIIARLTWLGRRLPGRADWRLGLVAALVVFGVLVAAGIPGKQGRSLSTEGWRLFKHFNNSIIPTSWLTDWTVDLGLEALMLAVVSLVVGWAVAVIGIRFPAVRPDQAADFADGVALGSGKIH
ncbi:hypothetical protein [Zavarzinella formosa]|uniref:hypothetical protein n=1 Tax=Zavarzinella formosa TaxID=360055 RepID=UPI00031C94D3|nr:hypothetical protein [Zavarzinella formosa]